MLLGRFCGEHVITTCRELGEEAKINDFCLALNLSVHRCSKCEKKTYTIQTEILNVCAVCGENKVAHGN